MKIDKLVSSAVITGCITYSLWYLYKNRKKIIKKVKEYIPQKDPNYNPNDVGITYEELYERRHKELYEANLERSKTIVEGVGEVNPEELIHEDEWFTNSQGRYVRNITRGEKISGVDYDLETEEIIQVYDEEGNLIEMVAKRIDISSKIQSNEKRNFTEVIDSVEDFIDSCILLKKGGKDPMNFARSYEENSLERLDYYYAYILSNPLIEDTNVRHKLVNLFNWLYIPNEYNIASVNLFETLRERRINFFGNDSVHNNNVSVGEVIIYFATRYSEEIGINTYTYEDYILFMLDNLNLKFDGSEREEQIGEVIRQYMEHDRSVKPNVTGGFGLFGILEDDYENTTALESEYQKSLYYLMSNEEYRLPFKKKVVDNE